MQFHVQNLLGKYYILTTRWTKGFIGKPWFLIAVITCLIFASTTPSLAVEHNIKEYGIVILPEEKCTKVAEKLNQDITKILSHFKNAKNHWHVTLYHGAYDTKDIKEIYNKIKAIELKPFTLSFSKISSTSNRWIDLGTEKTEYLQELHKAIVQLASPYHKRPLDRSRDIYKDMTSIQQKQVDNYGVSGLLELYNPHMTLFYQYPPSSELQHAAKEIAVNFKENMVCKASKIVVGELGYNGNIQKIIYSIDIPN